MKKTTILILIILLAMSVKSQDTAIVNVKVLNELNKPIEGEQVLFEAKDASYTTSSTTNSEGSFKVKLIGGKIYDIKIKTIGDAQQYNTMEIPALEEGQKYSESTLTITIYETKSFTLDNVYFDSGKSSLKQESFKELDELYEFLSLKPNLKIEISGHTDDVGDDDNNMILSKNRALSVKNYLLSKGISKTRIIIKAYGETKPVADNTTQEGRSKNRRIEVLVL